jgi:hypothetical protein
MKQKYVLIALMVSLSSFLPETQVLDALTPQGQALLDRIRERMEQKHQRTLPTPILVETKPPTELDSKVNSGAYPDSREQKPVADHLSEEKPLPAGPAAQKPPAMKAGGAKPLPATSSAKSPGKPGHRSSDVLADRAESIPPEASTHVVEEKGVGIPKANTGEFRSFGEVSDEELIQYAKDHVWTPEKSRKHHPPWTPPSKSKKKTTTKKADGPGKNASSTKTAVAPAKSNKKKK